jgi:hypothetical protein
MLKVDGAAESPAALAESTGEKRDTGAPTDTDVRGVRDNGGRQEPVCCKVGYQTIPGLFVKERIPAAGGWSDDVVTFYVSFDSEAFPPEAEKFAQKSRPEKSAAEKLPAWQGST